MLTILALFWPLWNIDKPVMFGIITITTQHHFVRYKSILCPAAHVWVFMVFMARSHTVCGMYLYPYYHSYQALSILGKSQSKFGFNSSEDRRGHCIASNMIIRPGKMKMGEIKYLPCSVYLDCWRLATPLVVSLCEPLGLSCWVEIISATQCLGKSILQKKKPWSPKIYV